MFGNLKKTLSSAIQEGIASSSLQPQYKSRPHSAASSPQIESSIGLAYSAASEMGMPADVNVTAGCDLLAHYEDAWCTIHASNESNAAQAEKVAQQIDRIEQRTAKQRTDLTDLISCLGGLPALVAKLRDSAAALEDVKALSASAEAELERLEDLSEECALQEFQLHKQCELSQYKQQKMASLEVVRQRVAAEHQAKICAHEAQLRQIQRERQAVFDDAFRGDLAEFKQRGAIPKLQKEPSRELALEEVVLEHAGNKDALEEFLNE